MAEELLITPGSVQQKNTVGTVETNTDYDLWGFFENFSQGSLLDTGLLPLDGTGVLAIRQCFEHQQIVFQHKPDRYYVTWGQYERDKSARTYHVAQPWRIIIGDLIKGQLLGARHFYSPVPMTTADQPLYHVNLPNLNCRGYGGTSVGWMCLYHNANWSKLSLADKIRELVHRAGGGEAYNDANMSGTDGARFYQAAKKPSYFWNPAEWEKKTKADGVDWTLDTNLLLPILVSGIDDQNAHNPKGIPLTLEMAMLGGYNAYYRDPTQPKPINALARKDLVDPSIKEVHKLIRSSVVSAPKVKTAPKGLKTGALLTTRSTAVEDIKEKKKKLQEAKKVGICFVSKKQILKDDKYFKLPDGKVVLDEYKDQFVTCSVTGNLVHYDDAIYFKPEDRYITKGAQDVFECPNCAHQYLNLESIVEGQWCVNCCTAVTCHMTGILINEKNAKLIEAKPYIGAEENFTFALSEAAMETAVICACGLLQDEGAVNEMDNVGYVCEPCVEFDDNGCPSFCGTAVQLTVNS